MDPIQFLLSTIEVISLVSISIGLNFHWCNLDPIQFEMAYKKGDFANVRHHLSNYCSSNNNLIDLNFYHGSLQPMYCMFWKCFLTPPCCKGLWLAISGVLGDVTVKGCSFHWTQAVWRKIQALGLVPQYEQDEGTYRFLRKVLALPFLAPTEIPTAFQHLLNTPATPAVTALLQYVGETLLHDATWTLLEAWSNYGRAIRTNNDLEGWHNALNRRVMGKTRLPLYMFVNLLERSQAREAPNQTGLGEKAQENSEEKV